MQYEWTDAEVREMSELEIYTNITAGEISLRQFYMWVEYERSRRDVVIPL